jgi:dTDP-4-amino-4,6-dideoxygalactose transaminase
LGAFSFFPSKNLGAFGDGGLMTTNDDEVARLCRMLRVHGSEKRYYNEMLGYCSRLDEMQAAFLRVKLKRLDESNEGRRAVAQRYQALLADCTEIITPSDSPNSRHVYHQYTIRVPAEKRDALAAKLQESGIGTMIYYPVPLHRLPVYLKAEHQPLPQTEKAAREVISLPIWPTLPLESQQEITTAIKSCLAKL